MTNNVEAKWTILYITFIDFDKALSGSSVRPQNMYRAFLECGHEVKLLKGQQNKRKQRRKNVQETLHWLETNRPDVCYVEPPTGPFFNKIDHRLMSKVSDMGVPIGLFYRDAYWRYGLLNLGNGIVPLLKTWLIKRMQIRDLNYFKRNCDIIYLTSALAADEWDFKKKLLLPPGCNIVEIIDGISDDISAIYVGGVSERYGTYLLLDAFMAINSEQNRVTLKLVCRENEWQNMDESYRTLENAEWLQVFHEQGERLNELYQESDFALCPLRNDFYNDMAIPIKLMEYIAFGKPIVSTNCVEMKKFIEANQVGIITEYTAEDFARGILAMVEDKDQRECMARNCLVAREKNSWVQRANQVVEDLLAIKAAKF